MQDFWVFGYGSLMWNPGFAFVESRPALLHGLHRRLCVYSFFHRGTRDAPGLVMGLDRGGACHGIAFRVAPDQQAEVIAYLRAREQVTGVYREVTRKVRFGDGASTPALTYVVDRQHEQYAGALSAEDQIRLVRAGRGQSGANPDYVISTVAHLRAMGIHDAPLEAVVAGLAG